MSIEESKKSKLYISFPSMKKCFEWAKDYLKIMNPLIPKGNAAVVFDIDETMLRNRMAKNDHQLTDLGSRTIKIKPALDLYKLCLENNVDVYFVTARPDAPSYDPKTGKEISNRDFTIQELCKIGVNRYKQLFMMSERERNQAKFKYYARKNIVQKYGKHIILNVGDKWTDLTYPRTRETKEKVTELIRDTRKDRCYAVKLDDFAMMSLKLPNN